MPTDLDRIERQIMQLEMERQALEKESDQASSERLKRVEREISSLREESSGLTAQWRSEKKLIERCASFKSALTS